MSSACPSVFWRFNCEGEDADGSIDCRLQWTVCFVDVPEALVARTFDLFWVNLLILNCQPTDETSDDASALHFPFVHVGNVSIPCGSGWRFYLSSLGFEKYYLKNSGKSRVFLFPFRPPVIIRFLRSGGICFVSCLCLGIPMISTSSRGVCSLQHPTSYASKNLKPEKLDFITMKCLGSTASNGSILPTILSLFQM
jgi:hypothetical protein